MVLFYQWDIVYPLGGQQPLKQAMVRGQNDANQQIKVME